MRRRCHQLGLAVALLASVVAKVVAAAGVAAGVAQGRVAALMKQNFTVVKIDVGRFNRNVNIAERYGVPLKKGIPAVALVSTAGKTLYNTQTGELADARGMGEPGIHDFFARLAAQHR